MQSQLNLILSVYSTKGWIFFIIFFSCCFSTIFVWYMSINWIENIKLLCVVVFELFVFVCSLGVCVCVRVWLAAYVVSTWKIHKLCNSLCVSFEVQATLVFILLFFLVFFFGCLLLVHCTVCTVHCTLHTYYMIRSIQFTQADYKIQRTPWQFYKVIMSMNGTHNTANGVKCISTRNIMQ